MPSVRYHRAAGIGQHDGQAVPGCAGRHYPILSALHDQDRDCDAGNIGPEVFPPCGRTALGRRSGHLDRDLEAVLPGLVADAAAAEEVDVVVAVQVCLDRGRPVKSEFDEEVVDALERSSTPPDLIDRMTATYPDLANPYTLWVAAYDLLGSRT